jgi:SpoVK/Ycf46/Vps4 family AAA+-type ATPase
MVFMASLTAFPFLSLGRVCTALHVGVRLDLGLRLFQDSVILMPVVPKEVRPESVVLRKVEILEKQEESLCPWNVPDASLALSNYKGSEVCKAGDRTKVAVGTVVGRSWFIEAKSPIEEWFRISYDERCREPRDTGGLESMVALDNKDITCMWAKYSEGDSMNCDILIEPSNDMCLIRGPVHASLSPGWMNPILASLDIFGTSVLSLLGQPGSGKTHYAVLLGALASLCLRRPIFFLDCKKLQKSKPKMVAILGEIDALFRKAMDSSDSIIILDDLDRLCPNLLGATNGETSSKMQAANPIALDQSKLIADRLSQVLEAIADESSRGGKVSIIVTTGSADSINPAAFRSASLFLTTAKIPAFLAADRVEVLNAMMQRQSFANGVDFDLSDFYDLTEGFFPRDLEKLSWRVARIHEHTLSGTSLKDILKNCLSDFLPLTQMVKSRKESRGGAKWSDIGGLFHAKSTLLETVRHPVSYRRIYEQAQVRLPRGILLYGPPGCGKSYLVPALALECNYPLITCKGPEILDKYIGASEAKVRELFERAAQMAPSILFLDELDALAPRRGSDSTGVTDRVVNQLLTFLDGVEDVASGTVYIIGATSRPDKIDPALIRPGRLERHLYIGPPESDLEWSDLLLKVSKHWNLTPRCCHALSTSDEVLNEIKKIPRLCPADIRAAFDTAHLNAVHRALKATPADEVEKVLLGIEDIHFGFRETRASLNENEAQSLDLMYRPYRELPAERPRNSIQNLKTTLR